MVYVIITYNSHIMQSWLYSHKKLYDSVKRHHFYDFPWSQFIPFVFVTAVPLFFMESVAGGKWLHQNQRWGYLVLQPGIHYQPSMDPHCDHVKTNTEDWAFLIASLASIDSPISRITSIALVPYWGTSSYYTTGAHGMGQFWWALKGRPIFYWYSGLR